MRLSLILPTYKEAKSIPELLRRISSVGIAEAIIVDDDSPDKTWEVAEGLKKQYAFLKVLRRIGKKGLSSAVVDGCDLATGDILVVMDSDLQHDPAIIKELAKKIEGGADIAVASRYRPGGSVGEWVTGRRILSKLGTYLARKLPNVETSDPMSGFFAVRRDKYKAVRSKLQPEGFKILFELLAALPRTSIIAEVPLQFQPRRHGESKLSFIVQLQFLKQSLRIALRRIGLTGARIFIVLAIILAAIFLTRLWNIRPLFLNLTLHKDLPHRLTDLANDRGWVLSDVWIEEVAEDGALRLTHRGHGRGADPEECLILHADNTASPCEN